MPADSSGNTPLHHAAAGGEDEAVRALLDSKADVDTTNQSLRTALHLAAEWGQEGAAQMLLKAGADRDAKNQFQNTPLHLATTNGHEGTVRLLLISGANRNARGPGGKTPLDIASEKRNAVVAALLREVPSEGRAAADQAGAGEAAAVDNSQADEMPTDVARMQEGKVEEVKVQIAASATNEHRDSGGNTLLHHAATEGDAEAVRSLLEGGSAVDATNQSLRTPLHLAVTLDLRP